MNDIDHTAAELRRSLHHRADRVEPSPDAYARLAGRLADVATRLPRWWATPRLWAMATAALVVVITVGVAGYLLGNDGNDPATVIVADPDPAEPEVTPDPPPADATPEESLDGDEQSIEDPGPGPDGPDPLPTWTSPGAELPMWPRGDPSSWPATRDAAVETFLATFVGQILPYELVDPGVDDGSNQTQITVRSIDEAGDPFGTAATLAVVVGLDDTGTQRWGVAYAASGEIAVTDVTSDGATVTPTGTGRAFEGTIGATVVDDDGLVVGDGFVTGGGTEQIPLTGSVPLTSNPGGIAYLVLSDVGGLGVAPVSFTVVAFELPPPDGPATEGPCSAAGLDKPGPQAELPAAVAATRDAIADAAIACDWEALFVLAGDEFSASFGGQSPQQLWPTLEANGDEPLRYLVELLRLPFGTLDGEDGAPAFYAWPRAFVTDWAGVSDDDKQALRPLYDDAALAGFATNGAYLGYRVGIAADGTWQFFVAGD